jgi:hypothetical protein
MAALALRSTTSTQRNDVSSRSHSILTITLRDEEEERKVRRKEEERLRLEIEEKGGGEGGEGGGGAEVRFCRLAPLPPALVISPTPLPRALLVFILGPCSMRQPPLGRVPPCVRAHKELSQARGPRRIRAERRHREDGRPGPQGERRDQHRPDAPHGVHTGLREEGGEVQGPPPHPGPEGVLRGREPQEHLWWRPSARPRWTCCTASTR